MLEHNPHIRLRTSPHIRVPQSVDTIMRHVVYALLPVCAFAIWQFGLSAIALLVVCVAVCMATEQVCCKLAGRPSTLSDWSVVITGILLALCLPPGFPLWMAAVASIFAVAVGKSFFGGLGYNVMNPALVGRAFAQAAFTVPITTWTPSMVAGRFSSFIPTTLTPPFLKPEPIADWAAQLSDGFTGATPLALMKFQGIQTDAMELFIGTTAGSYGETSALLILLCGLYLVVRRMMSWQIPVSMLGTAFLTSWAFYLLDSTAYPTPWFTLVSGGLMLGAVFMATDMVASPVTPLGIWIYGAFMGFVTVIIRLFGGLPEGVMYAILLGNAISPLISRVTQPRIFGEAKPKPAAS